MVEVTGTLFTAVFVGTGRAAGSAGYLGTALPYCPFPLSIMSRVKHLRACMLEPGFLDPSPAPLTFNPLNARCTPVKDN